MLVFLYIILWSVVLLISLLLIAMLLIFFLNIKIEVKKLKLNYSDKPHNKEFEILINVKGYLFNFIRILNVNINKQKIEKYLKNKTMKQMYKKILNNSKFDTKIIQSANKYYKYYKDIYGKNPIKLEKMNLIMQLNIINIEISTYLVTFLIILLSIPLPSASEKKIDYKYNMESKNSLDGIININILFNSIITINLKHIIIILLKITLGRVKKNGRTSNRRLNAYSYE